MDKGIKTYYEMENGEHFFTVKLSAREAKKEALQRAVSRMFKADWVVMAGLWLDDENGEPDIMDEFGPEGDALWTRLLNGVALFEDMANAKEALDEELRTQDYKDYQAEVDIKKDELDGEELEAALAELDRENAALLQRLSDLNTRLQEATSKYDSNFPEE